MAEAEDVITDAARHATVYVRALWRRHRPPKAGPPATLLAELAPRLDLLACAVFQRSFTLRAAQAPAPPTWLNKLLLRGQAPPQRFALPGTDGDSIWLPGSFPDGAAAAGARYRIMLLQQAMRATRGSARHCPGAGTPLLRALYLLLEARAADAALLALLPGAAAPLLHLRAEALSGRPALGAFAPAAQTLERLARALLSEKPWAGLAGLAMLRLPASPAEVLLQAASLRDTLPRGLQGQGGRLLFSDWWSGELRAPAAAASVLPGAAGDESDGAPRSAHLSRRPEVRQALPDEDEAGAAAPFMVQTAQPHEQAEDPMGMQRPSDRADASAAAEFADALSELPEARLVVAPGKPKEVLLSDDAPPGSARGAPGGGPGAVPERRRYPEWDWRSQSYLDPGATVQMRESAPGPRAWLERTLAERGAMLHEIRRRFELLRAQRTRVRKQLDGDDIDLPAWLDSQADFRAGLALEPRLYQRDRRARRDMAVMLLVDVSGSTDGWIAPGRRVIDVEREALLLVCIALDGMAERFSVQAFSGEGPQGVVVRSVKRFDENYGEEVALRIAGLEPEHYTRAGAALRHASALLMEEPAEHRLLLLLSDGKPNDIDEYEGRYGVEDMRQAVAEARLQGIAPFCLTVDRQAAGYLPKVFGPHHYALLPRPELLPAVLLDWLRRLMAR
ncbi:nitric oxide reductase activation protein NorD [Janthinobacterium sp.]|uniref:nitric oxide reductase activation protein NorD n=1 Tax=Janthinobacterium sp. TaxID=1871054 RepID=UPI00293D560F|nr:VWA domain-containing protein [Janthinobacterium sp.]